MTVTNGNDGDTDDNDTIIRMTNKYHLFVQ